MPVTLAVDAERLVGDFLRSFADMTAQVGTRVFTSIPNGQAVAKFVQFGQIGGTKPVGHWGQPVTPRVDAATIDFHSYGATRQDAKTVALTVEAVMYQAIGTRALGTVLNVEQTLGLIWNPDPGYEPPAPRFTQTFTVWIRPN